MAKERLRDLKQFSAPQDELPPASAPSAWGAPEIDLDSLAVAPEMLTARRQEIEVGPNRGPRSRQAPACLSPSTPELTRIDPVAVRAGRARRGPYKE